MLVALMAHDKDGALETRMANREAHVAYLKGSDIVHLAGPLLDDAEQMIGSLIILDVKDMAQAKAWAAEDPYAKAGLFRDVTLTPWRKVIG